MILISFFIYIIWILASIIIFYPYFIYSFEYLILICLIYFYYNYYHFHFSALISLILLISVLTNIVRLGTIILNQKIYNNILQFSFLWFVFVIDLYSIFIIFYSYKQFKKEFN